MMERSMGSKSRRHAMLSYGDREPSVSTNDSNIVWTKKKPGPTSIIENRESNLNFKFWNLENRYPPVYWPITPVLKTINRHQAPRRNFDKQHVFMHLVQNSRLPLHFVARP
jgi:hypothetical protein